VRACARVYVSVCMCVRMCACECVCMCVCMCVCICVECAVIGVYDKLKAEVPIGIVVMAPSHAHIPPEEIETETIEMIRNSIGALCSYRQTIVLEGISLPKTRSGKILRRCLKEIYEEEQVRTVPATIEDESALHDFLDVLKRVRRKHDAFRV